MRIEGSAAVNHQQYLGSQTQGQGVEGKSMEAPQPIKQEQSRSENFPGERQFAEAIEDSNKDLQINNTNLKFSIHEKTKEILVKVVDSQTQEVIREIPSEKILDMVAAMLERTGLFVDKKA